MPIKGLIDLTLIFIGQNRDMNVKHDVRQLIRYVFNVYTIN